MIASKADALAELNRIAQENERLRAQIGHLKKRVIDAEMLLGPFDEGEDSEYWTRYPVFMQEQLPTEDANTLKDVKK